MVVITISVFAFTATSFEEDRDVSVVRTYELRLTKAKFDQRLKSLRKIRDVKIEKQTDVWPANQYPDVKTKPNSYYVRFTLAEKYCDSNELRIFLTFDEEEEAIAIDYVSFSFWCKEKPTDLDSQHLISIFQREVIENLR